MRNYLLLALVAVVVVATVHAAPVRFGSGVNLSGMEFASGAKPGIYDKNYTLPRTTEVRTPLFTLYLSGSAVFGRDRAHGSTGAGTFC